VYKTNNITHERVSSPDVSNTAVRVAIIYITQWAKGVSSKHFGTSLTFFTVARISRYTIGADVASRPAIVAVLVLNVWYRAGASRVGRTECGSRRCDYN